ncbi:MAG: polysaccharide pyruvyl transferase family protein, partial [Chitinivibrionia bacterium]|nr:polysaccharide pyruvyl transferase family protein [Chitinivibrionia bacterium]
MNFEDKNVELRKIIKETLSKFIKGDCCLLGLPYFHTNVGDFLIWEGVERFLKEHNVNCIYRAQVFKYERNRISENVTILLNGGGNFGDVWEGWQGLLRQIINECPNNKIIVLPNTVFYSDKEILLADAELFGRHKNLVLCARDNKSFETLNNYFHYNTILLVPDMAFYIPYNFLRKYQKTNIKNAGKTLFLKRIDKELNKNIDYSRFLQDDVDIADWITIDKQMFSFVILQKLSRLSQRIPAFSKILDLYAYHFFKRDMVKNGVKFINRYEKILTTRLHAAILCCLLRKHFVLFDNSYGKNSSFYETWFSDLPQIKW